MSNLQSIGGEWALWRIAAVRGAGMPIDWLAWFVGEGSDGPSHVLAEPAFLAALTWQNPGAMRAWAGRPEAKISPYRARVLARYAQRYCAKNESIGFFGSVGWARLTGGDDEEPVVTGGLGVRWSGAFFERWAIEELAQTWARDERLLQYQPVRWHPAMTYDGHTIRRPFRPPLTVEPAMKQVLERVDGVRSLGEIARGAGDGAVGHVLGLRDAGVLLVGCAVPPAERPEDHLRAFVDAVPDQAVRDELALALDRLEAHRVRIAAAAQRPAELATALAELDVEFSGLTGRLATRDKTTTDSGRTLVYLDCRRDLDVGLPGRLIDRLSSPLRLLLLSARWFTEQVSEAVEEKLDEEYAALAKHTGDVSLSELHFAAARVLSGAPGTPVHDVAEDFRLRWTEILGSGEATADEIRLSSAEIAPLVAALFPAKAPGWTAARYHSPDVMLARTPEGLRWVLGELHLAMNTLDQRFFHTLADDRAVLTDAAADDMVDGRVVPCYPHGQLVDSRRYPPLATHLPDRYLYWSFGGDAGPPAGAPSWPATSLRVRRDGGILVAGPREGERWELPVREFFGEFLSALVVNRFRIPSTGPRVVIDDLVVRRRSWSFGTAELPAGVCGRTGYHPEKLAARLTELGLPRYLFVKTPQEAKPFYVDLEAPLMVGNLARVWRKLPSSAQLELHEMLPDPEALWLTDKAGQRYTSELRLVAVDGRSPSFGSPFPSVLREN